MLLPLLLLLLLLHCKTSDGKRHKHIRLVLAPHWLSSHQHAPRGIAAATVDGKTLAQAALDRRLASHDHEISQLACDRHVRQHGLRKAAEAQLRFFHWVNDDS